MSLISNLNSKNKLSENIENTGYDYNISPINSDIDSDDEDYLQKFDENIKKTILDDKDNYLENTVKKDINYLKKKTTKKYTKIIAISFFRLSITPSKVFHNFA